MTDDTEDAALEISPKAVKYDEDNIQSLDHLTHIRQRPGMYIGRIGDGSHPDDGVYIMFKEVVDNAVDEYIMGYGRRINISIAEDNTITVRDFGRGIPLGKLVDCVSKINTGGKFNSEAFQFSVGMNGVGTKAVNALSSSFIAESYRDGKYRRACFHEGKLCDEASGSTEEHNGTKIQFTPDPTLFPKCKIDMSNIQRRLWMYAYLNSGLSLYLNNQRYYSRRGLLDLIENKIDMEKNPNLYKIVHYKDSTIEFAFTHTATDGDKYFSFVNGQYTSDGGTHLSAFKGAVTRAINEHFNKEFDGKDIQLGIIGAISIKVQEPLFESQTKNKLGNADVKGWIEQKVKSAVIDFLLKNTEAADALLEKIQRNEQLRKEIAKVKTKGKEMAKRLTVRNDKLSDCKHHFGDRSKWADETMIFLTEGDSAGGSLVQSRDVNYQAVFALKGKPLNTFGKKLETVYTNEELYYIMRTLGIDEESVDNLRYAKIVIATDADVDGLHIRILLITFFLQYFESLVLSEHLYILETPLFRVRNKKQTFYCYSEDERDRQASMLGKDAEITRFKGLGEISPAEFKQFIGENIRLEKVTIDNSKGIYEMLNFYMGDNTPDRWEHIQNHLV